MMMMMGYIFSLDYYFFDAFTTTKRFTKGKTQLCVVIAFELQIVLSTSVFFLKGAPPRWCFFSSKNNATTAYFFSFISSIFLKWW
jgi:hypothetical protein